MTSKEAWPVWKTIQLGLHHAVAKEIVEIDPNNQVDVSSFVVLRNSRILELKVLAFL